VKLTGLFGLNDLYALIAIPATSRLSMGDRNRLEEMLQPIIRSWLKSKTRTVREIFEREITGDMIKRADILVSDSEDAIREIEKMLSILES